MPPPAAVLELWSVQILHRPPQGLGLGLTGLLQSLAHRQHMPAKFRQPHLLRPPVAQHSFRIADRPQGPSKDQPVEATQHSRNLFPMFRDKLLHGVSVPPKIWPSCRTTTSYRERKRLLRLVAALPRCVNSLPFFFLLCVLTVSALIYSVFCVNSVSSLSACYSLAQHGS